MWCSKPATTGKCCSVIDEQQNTQSLESYLYFIVYGWYIRNSSKWGKSWHTKCRWCIIGNTALNSSTQSREIRLLNISRCLIYSSFYLISFLKFQFDDYYYPFFFCNYFHCWFFFSKNAVFFFEKKMKKIEKIKKNQIKEIPRNTKKRG